MENTIAYITLPNGKSLTVVVKEYDFFTDGRVEIHDKNGTIYTTHLCNVVIEQSKEC